MWVFIVKYAVHLFTISMLRYTCLKSIYKLIKKYWLTLRWGWGVGVGLVQFKMPIHRWVLFFFLEFTYFSRFSCSWIIFRFRVCGTSRALQKMVSCNQLIEYLLYPFDYTIPPVNIELHRTCRTVLFGGAQMQILGL